MSKKERLKVVIIRRSKPSNAGERVKGYKYLVQIRTSNARDIPHAWYTYKESEFAAVETALRYYRKHIWRAKEKKQQYHWLHMNVDKLI